MKRLIANFDELIAEGRGSSRSLRRHALAAIEEAIKQVMPGNALKKSVKKLGKTLIFRGYKVSLRKLERIIVLGAGKASLGMAEYIEKVLGDLIDGGLIVVPKSLEQRHRLRKLKVLPSTHPIPSELGVRASSKILEYAESVDEYTLTIFLLSGGASALLTMPADPLTLEDKSKTTELLLRSGADINEINTVRRHLSAIKGGRLGKALSKGYVISLIISDVIGDRLESIGSGPTAPDPTTFKDAYEILRRYGLWEKVPESVRSRIMLGLGGKIGETPKPGDPIFKRIRNIIVAGIRDACVAAEKYLRSRSYASRILTRYMEGEASQVGILCASLLRQLSERRGRYALIMGGETTVTVRGEGKGGRNQELALSALIKLKDLEGYCLASVGTDGIDGPTDAAGAVIDRETYRKALDMGLNPLNYLMKNDSYNFFKRVGGLIFTGLTGTNVGDLVLLLRAGGEKS